MFCSCCLKWRIQRRTECALNRIQFLLRLYGKCSFCSNIKSSSHFYSASQLYIFFHRLWCLIQSGAGLASMLLSKHALFLHSIVLWVTGTGPSTVAAIAPNHCYRMVRFTPPAFGRKHHQHFHRQHHWHILHTRVGHVNNTNFDISILLWFVSSLPPLFMS